MPTTTKKNDMWFYVILFIYLNNYLMQNMCDLTRAPQYCKRRSAQQLAEAIGGWTIAKYNLTHCRYVRMFPPKKTSMWINTLSYRNLVKSQICQEFLIQSTKLLDNKCLEIEYARSKISTLLWKLKIVSSQHMALWRYHASRYRNAPFEKDKHHAVFLFWIVYFN